MIGRFSYKMKIILEEDRTVWSFLGKNVGSWHMAFIRSSVIRMQKLTTVIINGWDGSTWEFVFIVTICSSLLFSTWIIKTFLALILEFLQKIYHKITQSWHWCGVDQNSLMLKSTPTKVLKKHSLRWWLEISSA